MLLKIYATWKLEYQHKQHLVLGEMTLTSRAASMGARGCPRRSKKMHNSNCGIVRLIEAEL